MLPITNLRGFNYYKEVNANIKYTKNFQTSSFQSCRVSNVIKLIFPPSSLKAEKCVGPCYMLQRVCNVHWSVSYCIPKKPLNSVLKTTKTFNKLNGKRLCTDINSPNMMLFFSSFSVIQLFSCSLFDLLFLNIVFFSIIILSFSLQFKFQTFSFQLLQCWLLELYVDYLNDDEDMSE